MKRFPARKEDRGVRAVSPVIANVLMAGAVIGLSMVVLFWATSTFSSHQSEADIFFSTSSDAMKESLVIEDVWFYEDSDEYVNVTVRNVGIVALEIAAIYMNDEKIWDDGQRVEVGKAVTIKVAFSWDIKEYNTVVTTTRGNQVAEWHNASG